MPWGGLGMQTATLIRCEGHRQMQHDAEGSPAPSWARGLRRTLEDSEGETLPVGGKVPPLQNEMLGKRGGNAPIPLWGIRWAPVGRGTLLWHAEAAQKEASVCRGPPPLNPRDQAPRSC